MPPMTPSRIVGGDPTAPASPPGNHPSRAPNAMPNSGPTILTRARSGDCPDIHCPLRSFLLQAIMPLCGVHRVAILSSLSPRRLQTSLTIRRLISDPAGRLTPAHIGANRSATRARQCCCVTNCRLGRQTDRIGRSGAPPHIGCCRSAHRIVPISGKPEIGCGEPGAHNHDREYGVRARVLRTRPGMTLHKTCDASSDRPVCS